MAKDRIEAIEGIKDTVNGQIKDLKTNHATNIETLDEEAMDVIKMIIDANKENKELNDYID